VPAFVFQRYLLADFRGALGAIEPAMRAVVEDHPARRVFACALAHIHVRQDDRARAGALIDTLAGGALEELLYDQESLVALSLLGETAALLERRDLAPVLYESILPYASLTAIDLPEAIRGSMSRYLGLLAALLGRWDAADEHFETAAAANAQLGATPWLAL